MSYVFVYSVALIVSFGSKQKQPFILFQMLSDPQINITDVFLHQFVLSFSD